MYSSIPIIPESLKPILQRQGAPPPGEAHTDINDGQTSYQSANLHVSQTVETPAGNSDTYSSRSVFRASEPADIQLKTIQTQLNVGKVP